MPFLPVIFITIAALASSPAFGAVTFDVTGMDLVQRPVSVTGLDVNGVNYDVAITYNKSASRFATVLIGDLPDDDAIDAAYELSDAINAAALADNTDSFETIIYLLADPQPSTGPSTARSLASINDEATGVADFMVFPNGNNVISFLPGRPERGLASFSISPIVASAPGASASSASSASAVAVPEPSSEFVCATIALSRMLCRRRRRRTHATQGNQQ